MQKDKVISQQVIKRLPRYYSHLGYLLETGVVRVSSMELANQMNLTASQIRQDLNHFGCFGQQGYGYNVHVLRDEISKILGLGSSYNMIIIGAGNLGQALANYSSFKNMGFTIRAIFDIDPQICGRQINKCVVRHIDELESYTSGFDIDIAVLTLSSKDCQTIADRLAALNTKAIWNFASFDLRVPSNIAVEDVHLSDSLMMLSYAITRNNNA